MSVTEHVPAAWSGMSVALGATALTWLCTALGAALVFIVPRLHPRAFSGLLAVAAGVMLAAATAGLLVPAWKEFATAGPYALLFTAVGVALGAALSLATRHLVTRAEQQLSQRPRLGGQLFAVMSLHHVPEGMAVGLAVSAATTGDAAAMASATLVVLAMASHNVLEGALVSLPMRQEGASRLRAFTFGQLSGVAEMVGAVIGAGAVVLSVTLLPWGLAVAAGAMLTVTLVDVMPAMRVYWRSGAVVP
ncbi:MAG: ZIP family metal transporter [Planctomycetes bacterium]|jgi:ZIP family zinc transporter|nr:ZIP family metal transporter [Planctomycetota bacterium]